MALAVRVVDRRHDDQDAIGAQARDSIDLIWLVDEILAQRRQARRVARLAEEFRFALERRPIGEHRQARRAAGLIGFGELRRVEIGADQALSTDSPS